MNCQYCDKTLKNKNALVQHEIRCPLNENRIHIKGNTNKGYKGNKSSNQYIKAIETGIPYIIKDSTRIKISEGNKNKVWTKERREKLSLSMKQAVINNPDSYNASNVCGRVKNIEILNEGVLVKVKGKWEYNVANYLIENNIRWTNDIKPFNYIWNDKNHLYFPDFYLIDYNLYIEVKGYQREKDLAKWKYFPEKLIVLKKDEIKLINDNKFDLMLKID